MKLFSITSDHTSPRYFGGKTEALKAAREEANAENEAYEVREHVVIAGKAGIVALANGPGWQESEALIKTVKPRNTSKKQAGNPWD